MTTPIDKTQEIWKNNLLFYEENEVDCFSGKTDGFNRMCRCGLNSVLNQNFGEDYEISCGEFETLVDFRKHAKGSTCREYCHEVFLFFLSCFK